MFFLISIIFWTNIFVLFFFREPCTASSYSNLRIYNDSLRKAYFHEAIVIIVEREKDTEKLLICEIMSTHDDTNRDDFLKSLEGEMGAATEFGFDDFWNLMTECDNCDEFAFLTAETTAENIARKLEMSPTFCDVLHGLAPGTLWCGKKNIARNYFDLGAEREVDRCCRRHDLCPEKIRSKEDKYNLRNDSSYTKCHCKCDDELARCLKEIKRKRANEIGKIYFDIIGMECITDENGEKKFRAAHIY